MLNLFLNMHGRIRILIFMMLSMAAIGCTRIRGSSSHQVHFYDHETDKKPFKVVHAQDAILSNEDSSLVRFRLLSMGDTIILSSESYLILAHHTGHFLEFSGDTVIAISNIAENIANQLNIIPDQGAPRIDFEGLFSADHSRMHNTGAVVRCVSYPIEFVLPIAGVQTISRKNPTLCLMWEARDMDLHTSFKVEISDIFEEKVDLIEVNGYSTTVDFSKFMEHGSLFIVNVCDVTDSDFRSYDVGIKIEREYNYLPEMCEPILAVKALEMGFHLEFSSYYPDATKYYQLAADLSNEPIFDELLALHRQRHGIKSVE
ncbi:MAG: hypothetical protein ACMVP2_24700 [Imperialibacter sp.]|uniref:hypothetical protein n=1 Tax=Imperialibacter sp. TaxID=2038411 RepID=UPI003A8A95D6